MCRFLQHDKCVCFVYGIVCVYVCVCVCVCFINVNLLIHHAGICVINVACLTMFTI